MKKLTGRVLKKDCSKISKKICDLINGNTNIEELWSIFKNLILESVANHVPAKMSRSKKSLPWINNNLRKMLKKKSRLYKKAKSSNNWVKYKQFSKDVKRCLRRSEWSHTNQVILDGFENNNSKPFWSYVKAKKQENVGVSPLKLKGNLITDSKGKANILIDQFKSVFTKSNDTNLPNADKHKNTPSIGSLKIDRTGVCKLLKNLNTKKAMGPDSLPNIVLNTCAEELSQSLTNIFQFSIDNGTLPPDWLNANVSPIFKKGDRHLAENYRPVSLTSVCCKILEHIICKHMLNHFENFNILSSLNHGFRSGYSTETQLLVTMHDLLKSNDVKRQMDIAILDFSKAFDTVPHDKLLHKIHHYGIRGNLHKWLSCFLKNRHMNVVVEGEHSDTAYVESGVPQGTVLGPIMFLCHINDLPDSVKSQVRLFADDCLLYREIKSMQDHVTLQNDLAELEKWAHKWGMKFNAKKCYILSVRQKSNFFYQLDNHILQQVDSNPYLGVMISDDLQWKTHITKITKKANSTLGFLRRNLKYCPKDCKRLAYISLVRSTLEYGSCVWDPYYQQDINSLEKIQRLAARFINNDYKSYSDGCVSTMLKDLKLPPLEQRRLESRLVIMFKIVRGMVPAINADKVFVQQRQRRQIRPRKLKDFVDSNPLNKFETRNSECYVIPEAKTIQLKNSFFVKTVSDWNKLSDSQINAETVGGFKNALNKCY